MNRLFCKLAKTLPFFIVPTLNQKLSTQSFNRNQEIQMFIQRLYLSPFDVSLSQFKVFQLDSSDLGQEVAAHLDTDLAAIASSKFADGQSSIQVLECIRGHNVYLIKRFKPGQLNDGIIQLLIAVNTLKKQGAANVTCILPFIPYSQSKNMHAEEQKTFFTSFSADILKMLEEAGCSRVVTFNSLLSFPKGYVNQCQFMNINAPDLFVGHLATKQLKDPILVASYINTPNVNNLHILKEAFNLVNLDCPISTFNEYEYIGEEVRDRDVILYSSIMRTGNTFKKLSKILEEKGARNIYGCAFHSVGNQRNLQSVIESSNLKEFFTTNSLFRNYSTLKFKSVSLARLIAETITLFEQDKPLNQYRMDLEKRKIEFIKKIKSKNPSIGKTPKAEEVL